MPALAVRTRLEDLVVADSICAADAPGDRLDRFPVYRAGVAWLQGFITQPNPGLRRPGSVCPFVGPAMRRGLVTFAVARAAGGSARDAFAAVAPLREAFAAMPPTEGPDRALKALVVFFPDLAREEMARFIDGGHRLLKPHFVAAGQMIGEFHPDSEVPGSTNPAFRPMRAPAAAFAIRDMSPHDTRFLAGSGECPMRRVHYLESYLDHLGPDLSTHHRRDAEEMLVAARAVLAMHA